VSPGEPDTDAGVVGREEPSVDRDEKLLCRATTRRLWSVEAVPALASVPVPGPDLWSLLLPLVIVEGVSFCILVDPVPALAGEGDEGFFLRRSRSCDDVDAVLPLLTCAITPMTSSWSGVGVGERDDVRECEPEPPERMLVLRRRFSARGALACWL
jgi:hypothetical protein